MTEREGRKKMGIRRTITLAVATGVLALGVGTSASAEPAQHRSAEAEWHPQSGAGPVDGSHASLTVTDRTASFRWHATDLHPGHAYTVWVVIINNPEACATSPCTAGDLLFDTDDVQGEVVYGAGHVVGASGRSSFGGSVKAGDLGGTGWFGNGLQDPMTAEIHLVLNDHGPADPAYLPTMIDSYRGGCTDSSLPPPFPATAKSDGDPGPNTCRLHQTVIPVIG